MKKTLLLFIVLLAGVSGAWATVTQPTLTTDPENPHYYTIKNFRSEKYATYAGRGAQLTQESSASCASLWYFVANGTGVSIVPAVDPSVKLESTTSATATGSVWYLVENPHNPGYFCVSLTSGATANCWDDQGSSTKIGYWQPSSGDFAGTSWILTESETSVSTVVAYRRDQILLPKINALPDVLKPAAKVTALSSATTHTALASAVADFSANVKFKCRSNNYLVVGSTQGSFVASPSGYEEYIQLVSVGDGSFYMKGFISTKYMADVQESTAIQTEWNPNTPYYVQAYNGYAVARPTKYSDSGRHYIHNGGSGCVGWQTDAANTQFTIETVTAPADYCEVTYNVKWDNNVVATDRIRQQSGTASAIPSWISREYTSYAYDVATVPNTATATITATASVPFTISTSYNTATWYYAKINTSKYLRADDGAKDGSGRYQTSNTNGRTDVYKWAFFGNPYANFYVMNKAQGDGKYLYKGDSQPMFQTLADPTADNKAMWVLRNNSQGGFALQNVNGGTNWCINDASGAGNLGYWNNTANFTAAGSNWVISEVKADDKAALGATITTASSIYTASNTGAGKLGYPTAEALSTFNTAISTAQGVYDDPNGNYCSAYNTLNAAIATLKTSVNYTPRTDVYYTIVNARGAMVYDPSHDGSVDTAHDNAKYIWNGTTTPDASNVNNLWGFIEQDNHYYMYNVGKEQFASVGNGTYGPTWIFSDTPAYITLDDGVAREIAVPKVRVRATIATTSQTYTMSVSTSYTGPVITYDANGDGGVPMLFAESATAVDPDVTDIMTSKVTDLTPYRDALKEVIDACDVVVLGTEIGRYAENAAYTTALAAANTAYNNASATKGELQTAKSDLEAAIATLTLNTPAAGFYRLKNVATGKYLRAESGPYGYTSTTKGVYANGEGNSAATVIRLYDKNSDGKLYMYNQGDGFGWTDANHAFSSGAVGYLSTNPDKYVNWFPGTAAGQIGFAICLGNGTGDYASYLTTGIYTADTGDNTVIAGTNYAVDAAQWIVEEATTVTVTLNSDGAGTYYATFCAPFSYTVGSGVAAYTLEASGEWLVPTEITGAVTAGTPVLLKGTSETATLTIGTGYQNTTPLATTALTGTYLAKTIDGETDYVLGKSGSVVGFYHWKSNNLAANRAYVDSPAANTEVKGFAINWDELVDGIDQVQSSTFNVQSSTIYNLAGQRINKLQKGINIVNGKKVLVK